MHRYEGPGLGARSGGFQGTTGEKGVLGRVGESMSEVESEEPKRLSRGAGGTLSGSKGQ